MKYFLEMEINMQILELLKKFLEGRGVYPIFMFLFSWANVLALMLVLIFQLLLYIFKVKYNNTEFETAVNKELNKKKKINNN